MRGGLGTAQGGICGCVCWACVSGEAIQSGQCDDTRARGLGVFGVAEPLAIVAALETKIDRPKSIFGKLPV
jgi:hypothetical protein